MLLTHVYPVISGGLKWEHWAKMGKITLKAKATYFFFVVRAVRRIISGWLVDKIMTKISSFRVGTSKNENIDHRVKETLPRDWKIWNTPNFCFLCILSLKCKISGIWLVKIACMFLISLIATVQISMECKTQEN